MMRDAVINVVGPRSGGRGSLSLLVVVCAVVALLVAGASFLGSLQEAVMLNDPNVRAAQARAEIAQADLRTAQAQHDAASIRHSESIEASWDPITAGALHGVGLGLLVAVPTFL